MFCAYCGKPVRDGAKFCGNCGKPIEEQETANIPVIPVVNSPLQQPYESDGEPTPVKKKKGTAAKILIPITALIIIVAILVPTVILPYLKDKQTAEEDIITTAQTEFTTTQPVPETTERPTPALEITIRNNTVSSGINHSVALMNDGTVATVGVINYEPEKIEEWTDVVSVSSHGYVTAALRSDGTVAVAGDDDIPDPDWTDIIQIATGMSHVVGLRADGTVVAVGDNSRGQCDVSEWKDIAYVAAGYFQTIGVKKDGTVVAAGRDAEGEIDLSSWNDIVSVSTGEWVTVGLKSDGTVVAKEYNEEGEFDVSGWNNIVGISAGCIHAVGLKSDGTVVATGGDGADGRTDIARWTDIVAVSAGVSHTTGLKSDGTVVATGFNRDGQCDVSGWTGVRLPSETGNVTIPDNTDIQGNANRVEATAEDFDYLEELLLSTDCATFDCNTSTSGRVADLMTNIFSFSGYAMYFDDAEFAINYQNPGFVPDPLGKFTDEYTGYIKTSKENFRWICENIYHVEFDENNVSEEGYCHGDYIYRKAGEGGIGEAPIINVDGYKQLPDGRYDITVSCRYDGYDSTEYYKVLADMQMIDGEKYWTFYKIEKT